MEQEKKNTGLIVVLVVVIILLLGVIAVLLSGKIINIINIGGKQPTNTASISGEEILDKTLGSWGMCDTNRACYGLMIDKGQDNKYSYRPYQMWSDGFYGGTVEDIEKIDDNTIRVTVHYNAVHNMLTDMEEHTNKYVLNISKISQDILIADSSEYKKILGDSEEFFNQFNELFNTIKDNVGVNNNPVDNNQADNPTGTFAVENGYTEIPLTAEQRKEINDKLLVFNVEHVYSLIPRYQDILIGDDLFLDDCNKTMIAYHYVYAQLLGQITDTKYPASDYYTQTENSYKFDSNKLMSLAGQFFNKKVVCNKKPYDTDITIPSLSGGGWAGQYLKTISKYQNGNNFYLIIHFVNNPNGCLINHNCYDVDDDSTAEGKYFKLKYYKDNTKEYLISLEYIK